MTQIARRDYAWGFGAQALNIGMGLLLLPMVLRYLPSVHVGLWLAFTTLGAMAQLLELGFQPTIARNVAYVYAGARELRATGVEVQTGTGVDGRLLAALLEASRRIYRRVALLSVLVLWTGGTAYILAITPAAEARDAVVIAWLTFSAGHCITFYFGYVNAFLQGRGDQRNASQVVVVARLVQLLLSACLLAAGMGLVALGFAALASTVVSRLLAIRLLNRRAADFVHGPTVSQEATALMRVLWHNASRYGLVTLAAFLVGRANLLVIAYSVGVESSVSFVLAMQLVMTLQSVAGLPFTLALPRLNQLRTQDDLASMRSLFGRALLMSLGLFMIGACILVVGGNPALQALGSRTMLPMTVTLVWICVVHFLELNHGTCANLITTDNRVPFVRAGLVAGAGIVTSGWWLGELYGVHGLLAAITIWQLLYNNWRWPVDAARLLGTTYWRLLIDASPLHRHGSHP